MASTGGGDSTSSESPPEGPSDGSPSLQLDVLVFASRQTSRKVRSVVPDWITVRAFDSPTPYAEALGRNVGVAVLELRDADERPTDLVERTARAAPEARVVLVAADPERILRCEVPHDDSFATPLDRREFKQCVEKLFLRASYAVALQCLYRTAMAERNRDIEDRPTDPGDQRRLEDHREQLEADVDFFRGYMTEEDFEDVSDREELLQGRGIPIPGPTPLRSVCRPRAPTAASTGRSGTAPDSGTGSNRSPPARGGVPGVRT